MKLFTWDDRYVLGYPQIDREHEALFALAEKVLDAQHRGIEKDQVRELFERVINYTRIHFAHEEALMDQHDYPGAGGHIAEHRKLIAKILEFHTKFEADQFALSAETLHFLRMWLDQHIRQADQLVVVHMRRRERALTHA